MNCFVKAGDFQQDCTNDGLKSHRHRSPAQRLYKLPKQPYSDFDELDNDSRALKDRWGDQDNEIPLDLLV